MAMSSFDQLKLCRPQVPPCEEYSQNDYLPSDHSPGYYAGGQRRESSFQPESGVSGGARRAPCSVTRPAGTPAPAGSPPPPLPPPPPPGLSPQAPAQLLSGALLPEPGQRCEAVNSSPCRLRAPRTPCTLVARPTPRAKSPSSTPGCAVHVSTGECVAPLPSHPRRFTPKGPQGVGVGGARGSQLSPL